MASSSSSSSTFSSSSSANIKPQVKYDVFLSFRGKDTRDSFTSHLYAALCRKKIETFTDNQLNRGGQISTSLLDAIEGSKISIIVFSKRYASSRWCLDELVKILDCKKKWGQIVIPVFYRVDPSNVRHQNGTFGNGFLKLEKNYEEKFQRWRIALREAADLSGFQSHVMRPESKLIEGIANEVLRRLDDTFQSENEDLVGVESCIKEIESVLGTRFMVNCKLGIWGIGGIGKTPIESLLGAGFMDICKVGIWGIGGIGKTTIAGALFKKYSRHFEGAYFTQNVREAEKTGRLAHLRQELLSTLLNDENGKIIPNIGLNFQSKRLTGKKVIIVFDDVTHLKQIEFLIGGLDWFAPGSLIIITARDKQVLINCRVVKVYKVKELADADALKLFSRCAFGRDHPIACYMELTYRVLKYAQGVPLALKVLGFFLLGRGKEEWESAITKLETVPHTEIQEVLKISYDGLDYKVQNMFLDIACFFVGEDKDFVINFLDASDFFPRIGIRVLVDKSLITISCNKIRMHDLLRDMGRKIVREESINNPGKCSRLWHHKDVYEVLTKNLGTEAIEGISLDMSKVSEIHLNSSTFTKMPKLRFLKFYGENKFKISHFECEALTELMYLYWQGYPSKSLPPVIRLDSLVSLQLRESKVEQLWDGVPNLVNLKEIDLSYSRQLKKLPDLSQAQNLENLLLKACSSLVETHSSIQYLSKLVTLDMSLCKKLNSLPSSLCKLISLQRLYLSGCSNLQRIPESIIHLSKLEMLHLKYCSKLRSLPKLPCNLFSVGARRCTSLEALSSFSILFSSTSPLNDQYFNLSDCLKLDQNELRGIAEDALQKIQQKATSRWKKLKEETYYQYESSCAGIYFPGSEIPKWFRFPSMGSSIAFKPQSDWINNKFMGFAFCAIVAFLGHHGEEASFQLRCTFRFKFRNYSWYVRTIDYVELDHLFMGYYFFDRENLDVLRSYHGSNDEASFKIYFFDNFGTTVECCGVKKCGIRLLYAEDYFVGINPRSQQNSNSNEEVEPHPKRLKYYYSYYS